MSLQFPYKFPCWSALVLVQTIVLSSASYGVTLPVEIEADRLVLAAQQALQEDNLEAANAYLIRAQTLNTKLPNTFDYYMGKVLFQQNQFKKAESHLLKFVVTVKSDDPLYEETLTLITEVEKKLQKKPEIKSTDKIKIAWSNSDDKTQFIKKLKKLYLTDNTHLALEQHINDLLQSYPVQQSTIRNTNKPRDRSYFIDSSEKGSIKVSLQVNNQNKQFKKTLEANASKISVYGINNNIQFKCEDSSRSCWLKNPITDKKWLEIDNNPAAAAELTKAMGLLIRHMQSL